MLSNKEIFDKMVESGSNIVLLELVNSNFFIDGTGGLACVRPYNCSDCPFFGDNLKLPPGVCASDTFKLEELTIMIKNSYTADPEKWI